MKEKKRFKGVAFDYVENVAKEQRLLSYCNDLDRCKQSCNTRYNSLNFNYQGIAIIDMKEKRLVYLKSKKYGG